MEAFFWFAVAVTVVGWYVGNETRVRRWFYTPPKGAFRTEKWLDRKDIPVIYENENPVIVKPKISGSYYDKQALIKDLAIVTNNPLLGETLQTKTYSEILETLTPEQIDDIKSIRSFLL